MEVFLGHGQAGMAQKFGYGFDIRLAVKQKYCKRMPCAMPSDMLFDAGFLHPCPQDGFAGGIGRKPEKRFMDISFIPYDLEVGVVQGYAHPAIPAMPFGLGLLKL